MEENCFDTLTNTDNGDVSVSQKYGQRNITEGFKKYFIEYCENSSINGFKYLAEKRTSIERMIWILFITLSFVISFYLIVETYIKFEENPFIVSLDTKISSIYSIPFPAVTICPMTKAYSTKVNFTILVHKLWDNETLDDEQIKYAQYLSLLCRYNNKKINRILPQLSTVTDAIYDQLKEFQLPIEDLSLCSFLETEYDTCNNYFRPIILDEGICFSFNMLDRQDIFRENVFQFQDYHQINKTTNWTIENGYPKNYRDVYPRRALLAGADNALEIFLSDIGDNSDYLCTDILQGFKVVLHTPHSIPQLTKNFFILPKDSSVVAVAKPQVITTSAEVKKYRPEKRQCYFSEERYLNFFKIYSQENCKLECLSNYTLDRCGCVNFYMPRFNTTPICGNAMITCMQNAERELKKFELRKDITPGDNRNCNCMPLCTDIFYDSSETIMPMNWRDIFKANRFDKGFKRLALETDLHVSKLTVFFSSDQFISSQRNELYGTLDFIANFGGLLGLFNGFSLLSLVEIIYYLTLRLWSNAVLYNNFMG